MGRELRSEPRAEALLEALLDTGVTHLVGLPDSISAAVVELALERERPRYVPVTREGEAFGLASGLWVGGATPAVVVQNTGLLESGDALRGTAARMGVPLLVLVTWRGHGHMGPRGTDPSAVPPSAEELTDRELDTAAVLTTPTLDAWGVPWAIYAGDRHRGKMDALVARARRESRPVALLLPRPLQRPDRPGTPPGPATAPRPFTPAATDSAPGHPPATAEDAPSVDDLLRPLARRRTDEVVVTTMSAVRPWGRLSDHDLDFGSADSAMGHAADLALGVALARPDRRVVCLNGDGSMLMSLGTLVTIGAAAPGNLALVVIENGTYEITGNQPVPGAGRTDLTAMARAAGFARVLRVSHLRDAEEAMEAALHGPAPVFVGASVRPGHEGPIRRGPHESARYLRSSLARWAHRMRAVLDGSKDPSPGGGTTAAADP